MYFNSICGFIGRFLQTHEILKKIQRFGCEIGFETFCNYMLEALGITFSVLNEKALT